MLAGIAHDDQLFVRKRQSQGHFGSICKVLVDVKYSIFVDLAEFIFVITCIKEPVSQLTSVCTGGKTAQIQYTVVVTSRTSAI